MNKFTLKDLKILRELSENPLQSLAKIGKRVRLSREVVRYRLQRLEKKKLIKYHVYTYYPKLGRMHFGLFLRLIKIGENTKEEIIHFFKKKNYCQYLREGLGEWDWFAFILARNSTEFSKYVTEIVSNFKNNISNYEIFQLLEEHHFLGKFFGIDYENTKKYFKEKVSEIPTKVDKLDLQLLKLLRTDKKINYSLLAKTLKVSADKVRYRIKNMINDQIIHFKITPNYYTLGITHSLIFLQFPNLTADTKKKIISFSKFHDKVEKVAFYLSKWNIRISVFSKDVFELQNILTCIKQTFSEEITDFRLVHVLEGYSPEKVTT